MDSRAEPRDPQIEGGQRVSPAAAMSGRTQNRDVPGRVGTGVAGRDDREQSGNGRPQTQIFTSKNTRDPTAHTHTTEHTMKHHMQYNAWSSVCQVCVHLSPWSL